MWIDSDHMAVISVCVGIAGGRPPWKIAPRLCSVKSHHASTHLLVESSATAQELAMVLRSLKLLSVIHLFRGTQRARDYSQSIPVHSCKLQTAFA